MTAVVLSAALLQLTAFHGELPPQVDPRAVMRVVWMSADSGDSVQTSRCHVQLPRRWSCNPQSIDRAGVVVFETGAGVGFVLMGPTGIVASDFAPWGRMIRVIPVTSESEVTAAALRISRPVARPNTRSLDVAPKADVRIWAITGTAFWIAGTDRSPDAFIRITAEHSASHDEPLEWVSSDAANVPLDLMLRPPAALTGRVETQSGAAVSGALVDLFALTPGERGQSTPQMLKASDVMRIAETRTDEAGAFVFDELESQMHKVAVVDFEHGRAEQWTTIELAPLLVRLNAPPEATGRVLRQKLPVGGVIVRFIPDAAAWRESSDPAAHLTLDTSSDDTGRFALRLPPAPDGSIQLTAPDGPTKRVRLPPITKTSEFALGDIVLDDPIAAEVQIDMAGCTVSAAGPAGAGGFSIVRARSDGVVHALQLPEPGQWLLQVECGGCTAAGHSAFDRSL